MTTFLVAHGAWSAGWAWKKMRPELAARGHQLFIPTYTGLGERVHLATPEVGLETHIQDVVAVLEFEDLRDVVLVGHSYGGMVATGVADRAPERLAQIVYLDTSEADLAWVTPRRVMHPLKAFEEPLRLTGSGQRLPRRYIYCTRLPPGAPFGQFARRARSEPGWRYFELDASHSPNVTAPEALGALLDDIGAGPPAAHEPERRSGARPGLPASE